MEKDSCDMEASGSKNVPAECRFSNLQLLGRTLGHLSAVYCALFDSSGRYIFTGADDELVKVWEAASGRLLSTLRGASAEITDLAVNYENTLLAAGSVDRIVRVWCLQTAFPVATLVVHNGAVTSVKFCPTVVNGCRYLTSTSTDSTIAFWKYVANDSETSFEKTPRLYFERMSPGSAQITCSSFSPGGMFLAAGNADRNVRVYKMDGTEGPTRILEKEAHSDRVDSIQWAHSHLKFASGSKDGTCLIWYYEQQVWKSIKLLMTTKLPGMKVNENVAEVELRVTMLTWDKSDQYVITASSDNSIKVWNSITGDLIQILNAHRADTFVIENHPLDSKILLSADHDGKLFIWNIISGEILASFRNIIESQGFGAIFDVKWSPDGKLIAATDSHGHILTFGFELPSVVRNVPRELFFHTDYYPLTRLSNHVVLDKQTQTPPHLMSTPFLVDSDGNPYAPYLQKFVPGRENCSVDQLVPKVVLDDEGRQEVIGSDFTKSETVVARKPGSNLEPRICIPRADDIRRISQTKGNHQRNDKISRTKRLICEPLDKSSVKAIAERIESVASIELLEYHKESINLIPLKPPIQSITIAKRPLRWRQPTHMQETGASQVETEFSNPNQLDQSAGSRSNRSSIARPLGAKRTRNNAAILQSTSDEDSEENGDDRAEKERQKTNSSVSGDSIRSRERRRNLRVRFNVANNDSCEEREQRVNVGVSVSSRGRIRKLTAKARASVSRD